MTWLEVLILASLPFWGLLIVCIEMFFILWVWGHAQNRAMPKDRIYRNERCNPAHYTEW